MVQDSPGLGMSSAIGKLALEEANVAISSEAGFRYEMNISANLW